MRPSKQARLASKLNRQTAAMSLCQCAVQGRSILTLLMSALALAEAAFFRMLSCRCSCALGFAFCFATPFSFLTTVWVTLVTFLLFAIALVSQGQGVPAREVYTLYGTVSSWCWHPELARCTRMLLSTRPSAQSTGVPGGTCLHPGQGGRGWGCRASTTSDSSSYDSCCCARCQPQSRGLARSVTRDGCESLASVSSQACVGRGVASRVTRRRVGRHYVRCPETLHLSNRL